MGKEIIDLIIKTPKTEDALQADELNQIQNVSINDVQGILYGYNAGYARGRAAKIETAAEVPLIVTTQLPLARFMEFPQNENAYLNTHSLEIHTLDGSVYRFNRVTD